MLSKTNKQALKLTIKKYKTALINRAITGKIKITPDMVAAAQQAS